MNQTFDFVIIGAGSAGCAAAYRLARAGVGTIAVLEAGATDKVLQVKIPFGIVWTRGSARDWKFRTPPQPGLNGRRVDVTRGKTLGGSSSINSMVWFRGRRDDYDNWDVPGWRWNNVEGEFEAIESLLRPVVLAHPHPLSTAFARSLGDNGFASPSPEYESAGIFHANLHDGARWSAADAFLRPLERDGKVSVITNGNVDRIELEEGEARRVRLIDGGEISARRGILLSAGSIGSPTILLRSGIGPASDLRELGIEIQHDAPQIGANLHDHPAVGLHFVGPNSGYGLALNQLPHWAVSPFNWLMRRKGRLASNTVEAGAFFRVQPIGEDGDARPDCQSHFLPFMVGYKGRFVTWGSGYSVDVNVCRPKSRGKLRLLSADPGVYPEVDPGLLSDCHDLETLALGVRRLREILARAPMELYRAPEVYPGPQVQSDNEIEAFIREKCSTAYHPVGTLRMGENNAPVSPRMKVNGIGKLWVADASIMPMITTANTNAPSMMIGYRAGRMIAEDLQ